MPAPTRAPRPRQEPEALAALIAAQRPGYALDGPFYTDPAIFERDMERVFLRTWLFAGHVSQIPAPGDFLRYDLGGESVIVTRDGAGEVHALLNLCRHRGSRVCAAESGRARRLVCPYHGWVYDLDGTLLTAREMPDGFEKAAHGLSPLAVHLCHGLIFICFDPAPPDFGPAEAALGPRLAPYRLEEAKVAHAARYPVRANWKLLVENYDECYHCAAAHPEFSRSHAIKLPRGKFDALEAEMLARAAGIGLSTAFVDRAGLDAAPGTLPHDYDRYPLLRGHSTGSADGGPVAPLMGDIAGYDGGASDFDFGPLNFLLTYNDHVVGYRFIPRTVLESDAEVVWLVRGDAEEGRDYDLGRLTWLWEATTGQDKRIVEANQAGVSSRYYRPGPYSKMESYTARFTAWYLAPLA